MNNLDTLVNKFDALSEVDFWGCDVDQMLADGGRRLLSSGLTPNGDNIDLHVVFSPLAADLESAVHFELTANGELTRTIDQHQALEARNNLDALPVK